MAAPATQSSMETQDRPVTFEEYRALPDDGPRYELIYGELVMSPSPKPIHQHVIGQLYRFIEDYVRRRRLGFVAFAPLDVKLTGYTAVQPDLLYYTAGNTPALGPDYAARAPDLAVEVLSPSNRRMDLIVKRALYAASGIPEYWIVDPEKRTISVNMLDDAHYVDVVYAQEPIDSPAFPGIAIDFEAMFNMPNYLSPSSGSADESNATNDE